LSVPCKGGRLRNLLFPKVLNFTEDAHLKSMSTFETDEHLQGSAFCLTCRRHLAEDVNGVSVSPTSARAVKRCGLGAVIAAAYQLTKDFDAADQIGYQALRPRYGSATLIHVNDTRGHAAVLALFDEVIAAA
jgi:hypothetical protein